MNHYHLSKHQLLAEFAINVPAETSVQDNENGKARKKKGGGDRMVDTFSIMTSSSGINKVAQQLCVEPLIQLTATLAFPKLKSRGSVSYQAVSCIPTPTDCVLHIGSFYIKSCNDCTLSQLDIKDQHGQSYKPATTTATLKNMNTRRYNETPPPLTTTTNAIIRFKHWLSF